MYVCMYVYLSVTPCIFVRHAHLRMREDGGGVTLEGDGGEAAASTTVCAGLHARPNAWAFAMLFTARGICLRTLRITSISKYTAKM